MSNLIFKRLHWQDTTSLQTTLLSNNIQCWLLEQGSLTTKLKQYCREFEIKVQSEKRIKKIYQNEIEVLPDTQYWCREVVLYGDDIPWVAARTLISIPLLNDYQELLQLGNMPIGEWLFKQKLERQKMQWSLDKNTQRYARRSLFLIQQMPLLITELFLENSPITR